MRVLSSLLTLPKWAQNDIVNQPPEKRLPVQFDGAARLEQGRPLSSLPHEIQDLLRSGQPINLDDPRIAEANEKYRITMEEIIRGRSLSFRG